MNELTTPFWNKVIGMLQEVSDKTSCKHYRVYLPTKFVAEARERRKNNPITLYKDKSGTSKYAPLVEFNSVSQIGMDEMGWTIHACPCCEKCDQYLKDINAIIGNGVKMPMESSRQLVSRHISISELLRNK